MITQRYVAYILSAVTVHNLTYIRQSYEVMNVQNYAKTDRIKFN